MRFGLTENTISSILNVLKKYPQIDEVILYGSRAKGNFREGSDIDLTLKGKDLILTTLNRISDDIDDLLLPYKIDLSIFHTIENPDLIDHIQRVGVQLYKKENHA